MARVKAKTGSHITDEQAQLLDSVISSKFPNGSTPRQLVNSAKSKRSPIHDMFEWDNEIAGDEWRLHQARTFLAAIVIEDDEEKEVRKYHNLYIEEEEERKYIEIEQAAEAPDLWKQVLDKALREARSWRERYKQYKELAPVIHAIDSLERKRKNGN